MKRKKKQQAQQLPSLRGRLDTANSWKEKKEKKRVYNIFSLHE